MKAVNRILFAHGDDNSLGPIFKATFQKEVAADPVLEIAGVEIESAGFEDNEGEPLQQSVRSVLESIGVEGFEHYSRNISLHQDLISWADIILIPSLLEEDLLCHNFREAWSKSLPVECYCGQYNAKMGFKPGYIPQSEDEYREATDIFKRLFPYIVNKLKDSFCNALVASGVPISGGITVGEAFPIKRALDMERFQVGSILVVDRPGTILLKELDDIVAGKIIKKFGGKTTATIINEFVTKLTEKPVEETASADEMKGDAMAAFMALLAKAKGLVCSRGRHMGESLARTLEIPCVSSCIGATKLISTGQTIVVDGGRGEVYDASLLRTLR
jgi:phosphohistidine swiveling domain-containing protein